eukprot:s3947_g1.t1
MCNCEQQAELESLEAIYEGSRDVILVFPDLEKPRACQQLQATFRSAGVDITIWLPEEYLAEDGASALPLFELSSKKPTPERLDFMAQELHALAEPLRGSPVLFSWLESFAGKRLGATLEIMATSPRATIDIDDDEDVDLEKDRSPTELADDDGSDDKEDDQLGVLAHPCEAGGGGDGDQRGEGMQVESENIYLGALGEVDGTTALSPPPGIKDNRKRGRSHAERELKEEQDGEESESPSKKASTDAAPVSGRELRALLASHLLEMKGQIGNRISQVEAAQQRQAQEVVNLQGKTITVEKEIMNLKGRTTANEKHV